MSINLTLQRNGGGSLYVQIASQIRNCIVDGRLPAGTRLPTIRQLASDAGVTRLTVQNAYQELQNEGWVEATVGRGTFVSRTATERRMVTTIGQDTSPDAVINDIVQLDQDVGVQSLANASPDPALFPVAEFWAALERQKPDTQALTTYNSSQGDPRLRVALVAWLAERGIDLTPDALFVTAGVTQGLALIAQALARPGEAVLVEEPTYVGLLHTLRAHGLRPVGIPMDSEGLDLARVERAISHERPRFLYTIPNFQNPTGNCMSGRRRHDLLTLARTYGLTIVEDDIYPRLSYDGPAPGTLKALDKNDLVIHVSSFAKLFMPGLRLGYVAAPTALHARLTSLRRAADLCGPALLQRTLADMLEDGAFKRHLHHVLPVYRARRDSALTALQRHMPKEVRWSEPAGGFCIWLTLPQQQHCAGIQQEALRRGWAFAPGSAFMSAPDGQAHLRVCFGHQPPEKIRQGIALLAELVRQRLQEPAAVQDWTPLV